MTETCEVKVELALSSHECQPLLVRPSAQARAEDHEASCRQWGHPCARSASAPTSCSRSPARSASSTRSSRPWYAGAPLPMKDGEHRHRRHPRPAERVPRRGQALDLRRRRHRGLAGAGPLGPDDRRDGRSSPCSARSPARRRSCRCSAATSRATARSPTLAIVAWKLVDPPGDNAVWELRIGSLLAGVFAIVLFTCASGVANAPLRRKVAQPKYQAPPPPPAFESAVEPSSGRRRRPAGDPAGRAGSRRSGRSARP